MLPWLLLVAVVAQDTLSPGPVAPRYPVEVEAQASRIFHSLMSPFCPGLLIANCPSPGAAELKDRVRDLLAAGITPDSVQRLLYAVYGDELRASPPARGFGLLAWLAPGLALLGGCIGLFWWLRRPTGGPRGPAPPTTPLDPDAQARLDRELTRL